MPEIHDPTARAAYHASQAERLLEAAGKAIFQGADPWATTREQALMRAGAHASLAVYYGRFEDREGEG